MATTKNNARLEKARFYVSVLVKRTARRMSDFRQRSVLEERRSQIRSQRGQFLPHLQPYSRNYGARRR